MIHIFPTFSCSSIAEVENHDTALLEALVRRFNLSYEAFGKDIEVGDGPKYGSLIISDAWGTALEPAPVSPSGPHDAPFQLLSGTIKATYNSHRGFEEKEEVIVAPGVPTGNTGQHALIVPSNCTVDNLCAIDTRHYWNLTRHIFRYNHYDAVSNPSMGGIHTVNEGRC